MDPALVVSIIALLIGITALSIAVYNLTQSGSSNSGGAGGGESIPDPSDSTTPEGAVLVFDRPSGQWKPSPAPTLSTLPDVDLSNTEGQSRVIRY